MANKMSISWLLLKRTAKWKPILKEPSIEDLHAIQGLGLEAPPMDLLHPDSHN